MGRLRNAGKHVFGFVVGLILLPIAGIWAGWQWAFGKKEDVDQDGTLTWDNLDAYLDTLPPQELDVVFAQDEPFGARIDAGVRDVMRPQFKPMEPFVPWWRRVARRR